MSSDASASPNTELWAQYSWLARGLDWLAAHQRAGPRVRRGVSGGWSWLAMMVRPLMTLTTGETILLRVVPVDPRDLFRGDYVILSYEISRPGWNAANPWRANWRRMQPVARKNDLRPAGTG